MQKQHPPSINLVRNKKRDFLDKFINWALSIGRVIVMVTEIIALSAFLYRFSLDRELIDLNTEIKQHKIIVDLLKDSEHRYRSLQDTLHLIRELDKTGIAPDTVFSEVVLPAPADMVFKNISLEGKNLSIEGQVQSVISLQNYIARLKANPNIASISLDRIENKTSSAIIAISITAVLK